MASDKREGWLKSLKAGDDVIVSTYRNGEKLYSQQKIVKITPTGRIKVSDERDYGPDGHHRVDNAWGPSFELEPWTKDRAMYMERRKLENSVLFYLNTERVSIPKVREQTDETLITLRDQLRNLRLKVES